MAGFRHRAGYLRQPDLPPRQHAQAKAVRAHAGGPWWRRAAHYLAGRGRLGKQRAAPALRGVPVTHRFEARWDGGRVLRWRPLRHQSPVAPRVKSWRGTCGVEPKCGWPARAFDDEFYRLWQALDENTLRRDIFSVSAKPSITVNSRPVRSRVRWSLVAFARQESLPCVLRPSEHRAIRASEEKAVGMSLIEKRAQVARFAAVM